MKESKTKFRYKLLAVALSVMMLIAMVPATVLTSAWGNTDPAYDYLSAQGFTATYSAADDSISVSWTAIGGDVDSLSLTIDGGEAVALDTTATSYTASATAYAGKTVAVALDAVYGEEGRTVEASVSVPGTLETVLAAPITLANNLSLEAILNSLPKEMPVVTTDKAYFNASVTWSPDGVTYDRNLAGEQTFDVFGIVTLPETVLNRNNESLTTTVTVTVLAAEAVSFKTNLDATPISKLAGESLTLSVEGVGTVTGYQWYRNGVAIDGATNATLSIASLTPADAGSYTCVVLGKGSYSATSQAVAVSVAKRDTNVAVSAQPKAQSRPSGVTLQAIGLPNDATGTLIFKVGETIIGEATLPATSISYRATDAEDTYSFTVTYSGDQRYNGSTSAAVSYSFNKGTISMGSIAGLTGTAGTTVQVLKPTVSLLPTSNAIVTYHFEVSDSNIAEVDDNGFLTYKQVGDFVLTITADAGNDYNVASIDIAIHVKPAQNTGLKFATDAGVTQYSSKFSHVIEYFDSTLGDGELTVSLEGAFAEDLVATIDREYKKIYITYNSSIDATDPNLTKVLTGDIKVTLTKGADLVYGETKVEYTLRINPGQQVAPTIDNNSIVVTYGDTNVALPQIHGGSINNGLVTYSVDDETVVSLNGDGTFNALKPGSVRIIATLHGNSLYADITCPFAITVNRGTMDDFAFANAEVNGAFGVKVENSASGGPALSDDPNNLVQVTYAIKSAEDGLAQYLIIDEKTGVITFSASAYEAKNRNTYKVEVIATKTGGEYYHDATATYTLTLTRKAIQQSDLILDGAEYLSNGNILSNFGNEDKSKTGITITPANGYTSIYLNGTWYDTLLLQNSINLDAKDNNLIYLKNEDTQEISQSLRQTIIVDKQGPGANPDNVSITIGTNAYRDDYIDSVWSGFTGILSFDLFKESSKDVVIKAEDDLSDIKSIYYYVQTENFVSLDKAPEDITLDDIQPLVEGFEWISTTVMKDMQYGYKSQFTIDLPENTTKKAVVYVKIVDAANNVSYFRSAGIVFDNMAPSCDMEALPGSIINITLPEVNGQVGLYNGAVDFNVTIKDENTNGISAGIETIKVTVSGRNGNTGDWMEQITTVTTVTAKRGEITEFHSKDLSLANVKDMFNVTGSFTIPASFDSNHLSILVEVWDCAGNYCSNEYNRTHLAIDTSKPVVEVYYDDGSVEFSNGKYLGNGQSRNATIIILDRNFDPAGVDFSRLLLDGKTLGVNPTFSCVGDDYNGDSYMWSANISFVEDGDYTFNMSCTDKAKNKATDWYCDSEVSRNWTIDNTKPVIHVEMSNNSVKNGKYFDAARTATVTITERNYAENAATWSRIQLDHSPYGTGKVKLSKEIAATYEHVYTIAFDKDGDYDFDVTYTDLAGNVADGYTCNSASYTSFVVDTIAPSISIDNVQNLTAYNTLVYPVVTCNDANLIPNINPVSVTGSVVKGNLRNSYIQAYCGETIAKVTYLPGSITDDDIYTVNVNLTDMAGNSSSRQLTFSINRFGSNYSLLTENLQGQYLREERDVVFTETNVSELDHESLLIKMIKDGTPTALVEGTDYTIEKSGGNGQWSVYTYTIKKELFASDGHYNISVYSEDAAGNINESEEKKADISFAIDKTAPVIVPIDLEDNTPYATDSKQVSVEIKDNLLLNDVKILLNGKEVEYTADGDNYTFDIGQSGDKQNVAIVAVDAAGNTLPIEVKNVLVNASLFIRWYNNTPLFIGTLVGVVVLILLLTALALFGKKKEKK